MSADAALMYFKSLGDYLKTEVQSENGATNITVSNTAPSEPNWPFVVFTGVGIAFEPKKYMSGHGVMKKKTGYKVDLSEAPQGGWDALGEKQHFLKVDVGQYPMMTSDEQKHGFVLYPGQKIKFEMNLAPEELQNFHVEGTVSRRHLFHFVKELTTF